MKKKLRFIPLATAALMALGMSSVSAKTIYYSTTGGDTMAAFDTENAAQVAQHKDKFRSAQNKGWKVVVEEDGKFIDWKKAADAKKDYAPTLANEVAYQAKQPKQNADGSWTAGDAAPVTIKSVGTVAPVKLKKNESLQAKVPTVSVTYSDNTTGTANVTWGAVDFTKVGVAQTVQGTVAGTTLKAQVTVTVEESSQQVKKATATVQIGGLGSKKVTLTNVDIAGAAKFKVEGSDSIKNVNETITYFTDAPSTKVSILNAADEVIAEGTLSFPTASGTVEFDVTVLGGETGGEVGQEKDAAATVQIGGLGSKKVTLTNVAVTGAAKFKVEGSESIKNINETITYFTDTPSTKVSILNAAGEVIAEGTLSFPTASGAVQFKVTVLK